ncbi:MAG: PASTA domain-containing protein [Actinomycetota bacterium]
MKATSPNPDQRQRDGGELLEELMKIQVELDPKKTQLRLDLDLPIDNPETKRKAKRPEVRIGNTIVNRVKSFTEPIFIPTGKTEATVDNMSNSGAIRRRTSRRVKRNRFIAFLVFLLIIAGGWYGYQTLSGGISIPSVVGMNKIDATTALTEIGMNVVVSSEEFDPTIPSGEVISSNPGGGGHLKKGGTVSLVLSKGAQTTATPTPTPTTSETLISISSYVGLTSDQAQSELTDDGLKVNQTFAYSDSVAAGNVISQHPNGSAPVPIGSKITIVVSQGSQTVYIPNVYSLSRNDATTELENLDLKVVVHIIGTGKHVTNVSPAVGSKVKRGSTVIISLG